MPTARPVGVPGEGAGVSRRAVLLGGLAGLGAVALSACGGDSDTQAGSSAADSAGTVTTGADGVQEVTLLVRDDYVFIPDAFEVGAGRVRLTLTSEAESLTHNIRFTPGAGPAPIEEEIPILGPAASETIEFAVDRPGDYQYECSFHVALGQIGTMTVRQS
ncbi:plastocyanin/azurin family copper-binding protein [Geodermatophilus sp. FMUSA9-8]|uniref:plastocyanin/azurin family copper-binding protein n=1 Tax=Geodermatophilus sp. FMUSA9-8 TaxID=3120155 RepID=UPI003008564F